MAQAILLVGGLGTRLLPLTRDVPKPMLPIAGLPITEHQLMKAKRANITSIVLATSYMSEVFLPYFGDGSKWGIRLQYALESTPLGTGGAIRNAAQLLTANESVVVMNGDVLSSHDLSNQISLHESRDADVTLHLTRVADARAFGCVPTDEHDRVVAFLEKMENPITNNINAGCYIFNPRVIAAIEANKVVSLEREVFPDLVSQGKKIYGFSEDSYWLDVGNPMALLQGSADIVKGRADDRALDGVQWAHRSSDFVAMHGTQFGDGAEIIGGSAIGRAVIIGRNAYIDQSIVSDGAVISQGAKLTRCFVSAGATVPEQAYLTDCFVGTDAMQSLLADK